MEKMRRRRCREIICAVGRMVTVMVRRIVVVVGSKTSVKTKTKTKTVSRSPTSTHPKHQATTLQADAYDTLKHQLKGSVDSDARISAWKNGNGGMYLG